MNSIAVVLILFLISCQTRHEPISIEKKSQPKQLGKSFTNKDSLFRLQIQRSENSVKIIPPIHSEFELPDSSIKTEPFKYGDFNADGTEDILTYMGACGSGGCMYGLFLNQYDNYYKLAYYDYLKNVAFIVENNGLWTIQSSEEIEPNNPSKMQITHFKFDSSTSQFEPDTTYLYRNKATEILILDTSVERNSNSIEVQSGARVIENFHQEAIQSKLDIKFITTSISPSENFYTRIHSAQNSFFTGMKLSFTQHKGFVLSPDMIWLLIIQGVKEHIDANPKLFESLFLAPDSKREIIIVDDSLSYNAPVHIWENLIHSFTDSVYNAANNELTRSFINTFSTTNSSSLIVQKATLLGVMENWIKFGTVTLCGIPEIRLKGAKDDWIKLKRDYNYLTKQLALEWWSVRVNPILDQIISSYDEPIDLKFWQSMYKYYKSNRSGEVDGLNGWITNFVPYIDEHPRTNWLDTLKENQLPTGIEEFRFTWQFLQEKRHMVLAAGFMLASVTDDFLIEPKLNWYLIQDPGEARLKEIQDSIATVKKQQRERFFGP